MKFLVVALSLASVASAGEMVPKMMIKEIAAVHFMKDCWGEEYTNAFFESMETSYKKCAKAYPSYEMADFWPSESNRVTEPDHDDVDHDDVDHDDLTDEQKVDKMAALVSKVKHQKIEGLSNLTCVMKDMNLWKEDNTINIDYITGELMKEAPFTPELNDMFRKGYKMCYKMSDALPVEDSHNQIKKMFGKQQFFQKCVIKMETQMCAVKSIQEYMEKKFGEELFTEERLTEMGLPTNKYEASVMAKLALKKEMPSSKKFVMSAILTGSPKL